MDTHDSVSTFGSIPGASTCSKKTPHLSVRGTTSLG